MADEPLAGCTFAFTPVALIGLFISHKVYFRKCERVGVLRIDPQAIRSSETDSSQHAPSNRNR